MPFASGWRSLLGSPNFERPPPLRCTWASLREEGGEPGAAWTPH